MIKKIVVFTIVLCFLMSPVYVLAKPKIIPAQAKTSAAFNKKKDIAERKMKDIENLVAKIAKGKLVSQGDAEELDKLMDESVKAGDDAVKQSIEDAKEAQDSKGEKGSTKSFVEFEKMAKSHAKRAKAVEAKIKRIEKQIKNGDVEPDESLLKSMTDAERKEYMEHMTSSGQKKMKKKYPDLLSAISVETKPILFGLGNIGKSAGELCWFAAETVGDLLVPPAEAAIGAAAGAICGASGPATIVTCPAAIIALAFAYSQAVDDLNKCLAGQCTCKWYRPWCCSGRNGCWVAYWAKCA